MIILIRHMSKFGLVLVQVSGKNQSCYGSLAKNPLIPKTELNFLQDAFSLLAYSDPWSSPVGWQLSAKERESVAAALNSAILESRALPGKPPLEVALAHTKELIKGRKAIHSAFQLRRLPYITSAKFSDFLPPPCPNFMNCLSASLGL